MAANWATRLSSSFFGIATFGKEEKHTRNAFGKYTKVGKEHP